MEAPARWRRRTSQRTRIATGVVGLLLLSPLNLLLGRIGEFNDPVSSFTFFVPYALDIVGLVVAIRGFRSFGVAAALACVVNLPLLWWVGVPVSGPWASLFALPKYLVFLLVGWWSLARPGNRWARVCGTVVPTLSWIYIFISPWVSDKLGRFG